jgi:hypothetical protein
MSSSTATAQSNTVGNHPFTQGYEQKRSESPGLASVIRFTRLAQSLVTLRCHSVPLRVSSERVGGHG